ncbi:MAG: restriction endonuclease subunit S [Leptospirales bacterium]
MSLDVRPDHLKIVQNILNKHVPDREVWAFGSRVTGKATETSDLDLVIIGETPLAFETLAALRDAFSESRLPYKVDVVDWATTSESFGKIIQQDKMVVQEGKNKSGVRSEWQLKKIGEIAYMNTDTYSPRECWEYVNYLDTGNIVEGHITSLQRISNEEKLPSRGRRKIQAGDIVYSTVRPNQKHYGVISKPLKNMLVSTGFTVIRGKEQECDTKFLYYFLTQNNIVQILQTIAEHSTSTYPSIRPADIEFLEINLPDLSEQRAIAHILGTLDDKIELNRRMNETLEAMAQAIFKSWFVDFDPVRAKMEGRETGLPKEIEDLFPDSFEDSELGEIPRGWGVGSIGESFNIIMGQSPPGESYNVVGEGIPFYQGSGDFGSRFPKRRVFCSSPKRFANAGDTLISVRAPVGEINMALEDCCIGRGVAAARHKTMSRSYTYHFMCSFSQIFDHFEAEGTVFGSINKNDLHSIQSILPPGELIKSYEKTVSLLDSHVENNDLTSQSLSSLRDRLLSKLLSGEIRVQGAS